VELAQQLGASPVALGVETADQARLLQAAGSSEGQGPWFAAPLPASLTEAWAARQTRVGSNRP